MFNFTQNSIHLFIIVLSVLTVFARFPSLTSSLTCKSLACVFCMRVTDFQHRMLLSPHQNHKNHKHYNLINEVLAMYDVLSKQANRKIYTNTQNIINIQDTCEWVVISTSSSSSSNIRESDALENAQRIAVLKIKQISICYVSIHSFCLHLSFVLFCFSERRSRLLLCLRCSRLSVGLSVSTVECVTCVDILCSALF